MVLSADALAGGQPVALRALSFLSEASRQHPQPAVSADYRRRSPYQYASSALSFGLSLERTTDSVSSGEHNSMNL